MRTVRRLLSLLTAVAVAVGLGAAALYVFSENYVILCGAVHRRDARQLDLRGTRLSLLSNVQQFPALRQLDLRGTGLTAEQYAQLTELVPDCIIHWDVPFQGKLLSQDVQTLTITTLTEEELALLDHLPDLLYIDAEDCEEYALLQILQKRHPRCHVVYSVTLGEGSWDYRETELTLADARVEELMEKLPYLPAVERITLTGSLPPMEELVQLQERYPLIHIGWETDLGGATLSSEITKLDLRNRELESALKVEEALGYYPALTEADMRGCSLTDEEMMALADKYPGIRFLWDMEIAGLSFDTDVTQIDISGKYVEDIAEIERILPYFPNLQKVVMCGCGISNEIMDSVNCRYKDIRFVWSVYMGPILLRTDSTYFIPVKWGAQVTDEDLYNLRYCTDMVCIDIGHMDVTDCSWAASMPNLKYLLMADTQVHDLTPLTGLENLIYLELFLTQVKDLSPLVSCTALEDINLCYTYADPAPLLQMPWLQTIWWSGHWAARANAQNFRAMNPDILLEFASPSSTGNGWRELQNYYDMRDLVGMGYMTG